MRSEKFRIYKHAFNKGQYIVVDVKRRKFSIQTDDDTPDKKASWHKIENALSCAFGERVDTVYEGGNEK